MNWIQAVVAMNADSNKVFRAIDPTDPYRFKDLYFRIKDGVLESQRGRMNGWCPDTLSVQLQEWNWIEVAPGWKQVDYAEFMEWYCHPASVGKKFRYKQGNWYSETNNHKLSPKFALGFEGFALPEGER